MDDFKFNVSPKWNDSIGRRDYILNIVCLFFTVMSCSIFLSIVLAIDSEVLTIASLLLGALGTFYCAYLLVIWSYNRLRDAGITSEGWRVLWIILSIFSGIIGLMMFMYCCVKPTEDPAILIDENDYDSE